MDHFDLLVRIGGHGPRLLRDLYRALVAAGTAFDKGKSHKCLSALLDARESAKTYGMSSIRMHIGAAVPIAMDWVKADEAPVHRRRDPMMPKRAMVLLRSEILSAATAAKGWMIRLDVPEKEEAGEFDRQPWKVKQP